MTSLRSLWLRLHRWFALGLGWILILAGLTGTLLIIGQPLDRMAHPELFQARTTHAQQAAALTPILTRAHEEFGSKATLRFRLPQDLCNKHNKVLGFEPIWRHNGAHESRPQRFAF